MIRLLAGDCRDVLATLPAASVQCVVTSPPYYGLRSYLHAEHPDKHREIGSETTPDEYLATMVAVFREVRRVLRPDGTCWVNMGDSYVSHKPRGNGALTQSDGFGSYSAAFAGAQGAVDLRGKGYKSKDLLMMPARLALALQADGWWIRSDIIWHKPNPMPESVTDRPTSAHEHVFLLTKSARYFYDADAVREPQTEGTLERFGNGGAPRKTDGTKLGGSARRNASWDGSTPDAILPNGRNLRNVWTLPTHPYIQAHFATFPPALAERCIKAGTSERGCCTQCGKPWVRVTEKQAYGNKAGDRSLADEQGYTRNALGGQKEWDSYVAPTTTGWRAGCDHEAAVVPCTVLDPFAGAGTTLLVADRLQRDAIGIELNTAYTEMAMQRCRDDAPLFADLPPAADPEDERMADLFAEAPE